MFAQGTTSVSIKNIREEVGDTQLLSYYFNIHVLPCVINSPLRVDNHPSFGLIINKEGKIHFTDFKTRESGSIYDLLCLYWQISFDEVVLRVFKELPEIKNQNQEVIIRDTQEYSKDSKQYTRDTILKVKTREWQQHDIDYWKQYGISLAFLKFSNTYPISNIIIEKNGRDIVFGADKYAYVYVEYKDGVPSIKTYQPYNALYKWKNNHDASVWDLWEQLPATGDVLIITSSKKDAMSIWNNTDIPSISLQAESYLPKEQVIEELKHRFKKIFILYDNDFHKEINYGRRYGQELATIFNLEQIEIPDEFLSKDPSDLYFNHGEIIFKQEINKLIGR